MINAVLWDLDGTILDSKPGVFRSVHFALESLKLPIPDNETLNAFLGPPIAMGFSKVCGVPEELVDQAITRYREYYNGGGKFEASIYDGVADTLRHLREQGYKNYVTTSKPRVFAEQILQHFQAIELFDGVYGSELDGTRGHKAEVLSYCMQCEGLETDSVILVGDRHFDADGAKLVGIPCVGVLYGYGDKEELESAGVCCVVANAEELERIVKSF